MKNQIQIARCTGLLYWISMASAVTGVMVFLSPLSEPLEIVKREKISIYIGLFFEFVNCVSLVGIGSGLYKLLKKDSEVISIFCITFRAIEASILTVGIVFGFVILYLSEFESETEEDKNLFQVLQGTFLYAKEVALQFGIIACGVGGIATTYTLLGANTVPNYISFLGFVGYIFAVLASILHLCDVVDQEEGLGLMMCMPATFFETLFFPTYLVIFGVKRVIIKKEE